MSKEKLYTSTQNKLLHNLDRLTEMQEGLFRPISVQLAPTNKCNLNCNMCSVANRDKSQELSLEQCIKVLTDFKTLGAKTVEFSLRGDEIIPFKDENGFLKVDTIENIVKDKKAVSSFTLSTGNRFNEGTITDFVEHKQEEPLYKVTLSDGRNITVTKSHSLFFYKNGEVVALPVKDATLEDVVVILNKKPDITALELDPDFCRLLGYFAAEGSFLFQRKHVPSALNFTFGCNENEQIYVADVVSILKNLYYRPIIYKTHNKTTIRIYNKKLVELFLSLGVGEGSNNKRVPDLIFNTTDGNKIEFLKGLFAGDGNFRNNLYKKKFFRRSLHLKTSSSLMQKTLLYLLDLLSITATCAQGMNLERNIEGRTLKPSKYYTISISNIESLVRLETVINHMNRQLVRSSSKYANCKSKTKKMYINEDCYGLKIKKIEELTAEDTKVYDISVADTHRFESSFRILCHNTGGGDPTMYKHINDVIEYAAYNYDGIGLITNGVKLANISYDNLAKLTWLRISLNSLDYVNDIDLDIPANVTLGFSYVWTDISDVSKLDKIAEYSDKYNAKYVRIVPNCLSVEDIALATYKIEPYLDKYPQFFFQRKKYSVPKRCWMGRIKPFVNADGFVYHCSANPLIDRQFNKSFRMCHIDDIVSYWNKEATSFNTCNCQEGKCFFAEHNDLIEQVISPCEHFKFV